MKQRHITLPGKKRGPDGERLCRWCEKPVPKPRREWCSDACVTDYQIRADPSSARHHLHKRDKGVCADCGLDTERLEERKERIGYGGYDHIRQRTVTYRGIEASREAWARWRHVFEHLTKRRIPVHRMNFWDADHVKTVEKGGGSCGLDNLQTLCLWCHQAKTTKNARQRGKQPELPLEE